MATIIIFWASVAVLALFLVCTLCKLIKAGLVALFQAGKKLLKIVGLLLLAFMALVAIYELILGLIQGNFLSTIFEILVSYGGLAVALLIMFGIIVWIIDTFDFLFYLMMLPVDWAIKLFEKLIKWSEKGYGHFLEVIAQNLDKC